MSLCILWMSYQSNLMGCSSLVNPRGRWQDVGKWQEGERNAQWRAGSAWGMPSAMSSKYLVATRGIKTLAVQVMWLSTRPRPVDKHRGSMVEGN